MHTTDKVCFTACSCGGLVFLTAVGFNALDSRDFYVWHKNCQGDGYREH